MKQRAITLDFQGKKVNPENKKSPLGIDTSLVRKRSNTDIKKVESFRLDEEAEIKENEESNEEKKILQLPSMRDKIRAFYKECNKKILN